MGFSNLLSKISQITNPNIPTPTASTNSAINIPTDIYGYSGLPKEYRENILSTLTPQLISSVTNYPQTVEQAYSGVGNLLDQFQPYLQRTMRGAKESIQGPFQGLLNNLAGRGILTSNVASDALKGLGKELGQDMFSRIAETQAGLLGTQAGIETEKARTLANLPSLLGQLVGLGQTSEQPFQPYQAFLDLIKSQL